jgi:hypothetical protein
MEIPELVVWQVKAWRSAPDGPILYDLLDLIGRQMVDYILRELEREERECANASMPEAAA